MGYAGDTMTPKHVAPGALFILQKGCSCWDKGRWQVGHGLPDELPRVDNDHLLLSSKTVCCPISDNIKQDYILYQNLMLIKALEMQHGMPKGVVHGARLVGHQMQASIWQYRAFYHTSHKWL